MLPLPGSGGNSCQPSRREFFPLKKIGTPKRGGLLNDKLSIAGAGTAQRFNGVGQTVANNRQMMRILQRNRQHVGKIHPDVGLSEKLGQ